MTQMGTSPRPFKREESKSKGGDVFREKKDMVLSKDIDEGRKQKIILWNTFFRRNPHRFIELYFQIKLFPYQILMIWMLQRSTLAYFVASRAAAKSWIIALWTLTLAVLYPDSRIIICAKTLSQGGLILKEKLQSMRDNYPNVAREIKSLTCNNNNYECVLHNGSTIRVVPSSESSRGNRANYIVVEESRLVPREILEAIIKPFLFSRKPPYMLNPEYADVQELQEEGLISYITSAWFKSEYWFSYVKQCIKRMVAGDQTSNFLALDYLISIYHGIKTKAMIENEREDTDPLTFSMEYLNLPAGQSGKSYYRLNMFPRTIKKAFYPQFFNEYNHKKNPYDIKKVNGEIRVVSVDIATRANKNNDNSIMSCVRLIPTSRGYDRSLVYMRSSHGESIIEQALKIKQIYEDFDSDYIVLDLQQNGISVFELLSSVTRDDIRGKDYEGFTVYPHYSLDPKLIEELETSKTRAINAKPVIYPILASQRLNNDIAVAFRASLQKKLWSFLCSDAEAEEYLIRTNKDFLEVRDDVSMRPIYLAPYLQTSYMVSECVNLEFSLSNGYIKLSEPPGGYKDRYSSISYCNWFCHFLDDELLKENDNSDDWSAILGATIIA
jgi:hypothetical protein